MTVPVETPPTGSIRVRLDIDFGEALRLVWLFSWASVVVGLFFWVLYVLVQAVTGGNV
jgi:hypothetical protein